jgi:hypothetical protein
MTRMAVALVAMAIVDIVAVLSALNAFGIVSSVVAATILIMLPGAGLARLLLGGRVRGIGNSVAAALGLGLAFAVIVGVALDLTPIGIGRAPIVMLAAAILSAIALARGAGRWLLRSPIRPGDWTHSATLIALALVLATGAYAGARLAAQRQGPAELTQLWILPSSGDAIRIGVTNVATSAVEWRVVIREGAEVLADEPSLLLQPEGSWEITLDVPQRATPVTASLYRPNDVEATYEVTLAPGIE